ncbi:MAG: hypothetical protein ACI9P3_002346 [Bradyrhizobium sp.]|jgi:hypothetical protein
MAVLALLPTGRPMPSGENHKPMPIINGMI